MIHLNRNSSVDWLLSRVRNGFIIGKEISTLEMYKIFLKIEKMIL